ncbi:MAG: HAMP domain-containing sensor histidine kinase [Candidatus Nitrosopolaris sp.]
MKCSHSHPLEPNDTFDTSSTDNESLRESINHLKEVNKKLIAKYNNQREFVSLAAHELRSPIMLILGTLELIEYEFESDKKEIKLQREHFERLVRNTRKLGRLASEILDVTKIDDQSLRLTKEYFNLKETVLDLIRDHKRQLEKSNASAKILYEFKIEEEEEIPKRQDDSSTDIFINADKIRINQVIDNLLTNAIKFTDEGTVSISIICKKGKKDGIIASVRDSGTGIHPEILPRLFSKFATRSDLGTGLGLFISKNIVEAHGGKIWGYNNSDAEGDTFVFTLPLEENNE